jgi:hypothetical protein
LSTSSLVFAIELLSSHAQGDCPSGVLIVNVG